MTAIEIAKANLAGHSICLCKNGDIITDDGRGISPMEKTVAQLSDADEGYDALKEKLLTLQKRNTE